MNEVFLPPYRLFFFITLFISNLKQILAGNTSPAKTFDVRTKFAGVRMQFYYGRDGPNVQSFGILMGR